MFAVGHCGPLGLINRPWPVQLADWRRIGATLASVDDQTMSASRHRGSVFGALPPHD